MANRQQGIVASMSFHQHGVRVRDERRRASAGRRAGFSLVELAIAISILLIGMVSVVTASSQMNSLRRQSRERVLAQNGVRSLVERIQSRSFQLAQADPEAWSLALQAEFGPGSAGEEFDILELDAPPGAASVATVRLVTDETEGDGGLLVDIGMPRDLNGDGDASDVDVAADAVLLPCVITAQWHGINGLQTFRHGFYLLRY